MELALWRISWYVLARQVLATAPESPATGSKSRLLTAAGTRYNGSSTTRPTAPTGGKTPLNWLLVGVKGECGHWGVTRGWVRRRIVVAHRKKNKIQKTSASDWKKVQQQAVIGTVFPNKLWGCSPISDSRSGSPLTETNGYLPATSKEVFKMRLLNS